MSTVIILQDKDLMEALSLVLQHDNIREVYITSSLDTIARLKPAKVIIDAEPNPAPFSVLLSGRNDAEAIKSEGGFSFLLRKPFCLDELFDIISS